jgi:purine-nucleoside/S-methyl-5'-thioadenosine phosphorylase / adenosine deaminase
MMSDHPLSLAQRIEAAGLDWIVPDWPAPPSVQAVLTTRSGGVSAGALATMNLGKRVGDSDEAVAVNRRRLRAFLPAEPRWLHQVHGTVVAVHRAQQDGVTAVADAAVTRDLGVVCVVLTADCLPILLADRRGNAVGVAHAGWRGLAAGVLERTVSEMKKLGAVAEDLIAWLGPAIGPTAFEVGADVLEALRAAHRDADVHFVSGAPGKWYADLYGLARQQLADCGVGAVGGGGFCTKTDATRFYSWRRERGGGRMAALVWLVPRTADPHV